MSYFCLYLSTSCLIYSSPKSFSLSSLIKLLDIFINTLFFHLILMLLFHGLFSPLPSFASLRYITTFCLSLTLNLSLIDHFFSLFILSSITTVSIYRHSGVTYHIWLKYYSIFWQDYRFHSWLNHNDTPNLLLYPPVISSTQVHWEVCYEFL